jgi:hypothetical protein
MGGYGRWVAMGDGCIMLGDEWPMLGDGWLSC